MSIGQSLLVAHVSDIHYGMSVGVPPKSAHYFVRDGEPDPNRLSSILSKLEQPGSDPEVFVVSGDIGWSAAGRDYEYALRFLEKQRASWSRCVFIMVPGNHDVDIQPSVELQDRQKNVEAFFRKFYGVSCCRYG